jgi:hypothetical protein
MRHELFISYSRANSDFAVRLVRDLRSRGLETWLDQLDIPPGVNWDDEIEKALDHAKTVLVILSDASGKSENVKNEIGAALERGKQVVPVTLSRGNVPLMITRLQREDFSGNYAPALEKLIHRLRGGSRTASLEALTPEVLQRSSEAARARLAAEESRRDAAEGEADDSHGALHWESQPDSLAPATLGAASRARRPSRPAWLWGGGAAVLAVAAMVALASGLLKREPETSEDKFAAVSMQVPEHESPPERPTEPAAPAGPSAMPDPSPVAGDAEGVSDAGTTPGDAETTLVGTTAGDIQATAVETTDAGSAQAPRSGAERCSEESYAGACEPFTKVLDLGVSPVRSFRLGSCRCVKICEEINLRGWCWKFSADKSNLANTPKKIWGNRPVLSMECLNVPCTGPAKTP